MPSLVTISYYSGAMKDARKLFRLFKSINEYKKILDLLQKKNDTPTLVLNLLVRVGFLCYWIFDNLTILSKIKILDFDAKEMARTGANFWFLALLANLILTLKDLIKNYKQIEQLRQYLKHNIDRSDTARIRNQ